MFKQLRNRFLILNLVIISTMMLLSFSIIYLVTYQNVHREMDMELHKVTEIYTKPKLNMNKLELIPDKFKKEGLKESGNPKERSVSFYLVTDKQWNTMESTSSFDMDSEFYEAAKKAAVSTNREKGILKLDGENWAFFIDSTDEGYGLVFVDVTSRQSILYNLIYTFLIVAFIMLICIFFISRFFANRSIKPVKEAFDKQKQFIADASHELKTPLAVIGTNVDVLLANSDDTISNQIKWLDYIKAECDRMAKLTNELLYLTQMDYSELKMIYTSFNMSEVVENTVLTMEAVLFEHGITFDYKIEPGLKVYGNEDQMRQVLMIILDNAIKYSNKNGHINVEFIKHHDEIMLSVANTGEGIVEEQLDKIFDRFYRTDKSRTRAHGGYGLGLAIARAIVNQHKGKIYAKSTIGEKTVFYVMLPMAHN